MWGLHAWGRECGPCPVFASSYALAVSFLSVVIVRLKPDATRWRTGGEVKGKLANGVGSQYSYTISERVVSSITTADARTSAASIRRNWRPRRFKWTRPFRWKTKSGFCACAITFQAQSTSDPELCPKLHSCDESITVAVLYETKLLDLLVSW